MRCGGGGGDVAEDNLGESEREVRNKGDKRNEARKKGKDK